MRYLLFCMAVVGLTLPGCGSDSGALDAYEELTRALAENDYDAALELTANTSPAKAKVLLDKARNRLLSDAGTVAKMSFSLESEEVRRTVTLRVRQTATLKQEGQGSVKVVYLHDVVMEETDEGWRVVSFDRELVE